MAAPKRSLAGRVVLVTRPREQAEKLMEALEARGAEVIVAPGIEIVPVRSSALTRALAELSKGGFEWVSFTSPRTVEAFGARLVSAKEVRAKVACVGSGTAAAWTAWSGREPDLMPGTFTTEALARTFPRGEGRVLCARADIAPDGLEEALAKKGWTPFRVDAYRTRTPKTLPAEARSALKAGRVDAVTFTSASTVRGFVGALGQVKGNPKVVSIGPVTSREARRHGLRVAAVARPHTVEGVIAALERVFQPRSAK
jgi:uroporphyrinogen-III synthase